MFIGLESQSKTGMKVLVRDGRDELSRGIDGWSSGKTTCGAIVRQIQAAEVRGPSCVIDSRRGEKRKLGTAQCNICCCPTRHDVPCRTKNEISSLTYKAGNDDESSSISISNYHSKKAAGSEKLELPI